MQKVSDGRLALGLLASVAIWLFAVLPFLYGPPPRFAETGSPPQAHTDQAGQQPAAKPDGSISAPFFIRIPKTAKEEAEEASDRREKSSTDRWLMIFTGAVALFTLMLVWATVLLYRAGEKQLRHAETTAQRQLRAYVLPAGAKIADLKAPVPEAVVTIKNSGQTPAYKVTSWVCLAISRDLSVPQIFERPEDFPQSVSVVAPGADFELRARSPRAFTQAEIDGLTKKTVAVYAFGEVTFRDVFGISHTTEYRYMCGSFVGVSDDGHLFTCLEGNKAD